MISLIFIVIAALLNSVIDVLNNQFYTSIFRNLNPNFWDPKQSWTNKYKDFEKYKYKEKFIGSTTYFVWLTDAWHLFKSGMILSIVGAIVLYEPIVNQLIDFIILLIIWCISFELGIHIFKINKK